MNTQASYEIFGTHRAVQYRQHTNIDESNTRLNGRQFADSPLEPNFDIRPVPTKYALFPMVNRRKPVTEEKLSYVNYNQNANFTPAVSKGPVSGYMNGIDTETVLRNQTFGMQGGVGQDVYVPSSSSDLYKVSVVSRPSEQPHMGLFSQNTFSNRQHPMSKTPLLVRTNFSTIHAPSYVTLCK